MRERGTPVWFFDLTLQNDQGRARVSRSYGTTELRIY